MFGRNSSGHQHGCGSSKTEGTGTRTHPYRLGISFNEKKRNNVGTLKQGICSNNVHIYEFSQYKMRSLFNDKNKVKQRKTMKKEQTLTKAKKKANK